MPATTPSQTIGPFFLEGMRWAIERSAQPAFANAVQVSGRVLDGTTQGVSDALLEIWLPRTVKNHAALSGFQRVATAADGRFSFWMPRPRGGAEYANVTLFARGLLRGLFTRVYLHSAGTLAADDIPPTVSIENANTMLANEISSGMYHWDIRLRGARETVFFEL